MISQHRITSESTSRRLTPVQLEWIPVLPGSFCTGPVSDHESGEEVPHPGHLGFPESRVFEGR